MEMRDFIIIEVPGDNLTVIDTFAVDEHKKRFPVQWARYQNEKTDGDVEGTLLHDWPILNAAVAGSKSNASPPYIKLADFSSSSDVTKSIKLVPVRRTNLTLS